MADPNFEIIKESNVPTVPFEEKIDQLNSTMNKIWSVFDKVGNVAITVFNAVVENWKLGLIGFVALVVLLKD